MLYHYHGRPPSENKTLYFRQNVTCKRNAFSIAFRVKNHLPRVRLLGRKTEEGGLRRIDRLGMAGARLEHVENTGEVEFEEETSYLRGAGAKWQSFVRTPVFLPSSFSLCRPAS